LTLETVASSCPYSPECVEDEFYELRRLGILRSCAISCNNGIMYVVERATDNLLGGEKKR